jgi:hypothetical protein
LRDTRARLFATKVKNERLMVLRHALQKQRWLEPADMAISPVPNPSGSEEPPDRRGGRYRAVRVRRA